MRSPPLPVRAVVTVLLAATCAFATARLAAVAATAADAVPAGQPHIAVPEPTHDFGTVPQGHKVQHVFTVANTGDALLRLIDVTPACGCTTAGAWPRTLAPGASGTITIEFDTTEFAGPVSKSVAVVTNDPVRREVALELKATVWTPIAIDKRVLLFPAATDPQQQATRTTRIRNQTAAPLQVSDLRCDSPRFKAELRELTPGREFELVVTTVPPLSEGTQSAKIALKTSVPEIPELVIQAAVTLLPALQVAPAEFAFPEGSLAGPEKRFAVILNRRGADLQLTELTTDAPGVTLAPTVSADKKQLTITLTFPAGFALSRGRHYRLEGRTNQPGLPRFVIPIVHAADR